MRRSSKLRGRLTRSGLQACTGARRRVRPVGRTGWSILSGITQEFAQTLDVLRSDIADHEIAKAILRPAFYCERQHRDWRRGESCRFGSAVLEYEDGNLVLADTVDQMCSWHLIQVGDFSSDESELGALQFGQVEAERNLALKPGLHSVPVRGEHVNGIGAGERCYVQVGEFTVEPLPVSLFAVHIDADCE